MSVAYKPPVLGKLWASCGSCRRNPLGDLLLRLRLVFVADAGADELFDFHALLFRVAVHHHGGLRLLVLAAVVGQNGVVGEVGDGDGGVIPAVEDDFPPRRRRLARREDARVFRRLGKARAGVRDGPQPAVMHAEVPRARAAHREAGVHEAAAVHGIRARRGAERLEDVHLAGEFRGVAVAAVGMDDDVRVRREFAG